MLRVYDNKGKSLDRYTVVDEMTGNFYTMSKKAGTPQGFNQWAGKTVEVPDEEDMGESWGEPIDFEELPENVQEAIKERLN